MRLIWHLAMHDSRLFLMQKENFFFMLGMPVMFMLFFSTVLGGGGSGPRQIEVSLTVVNEDADFLSTAFLRQLAGESFDIEQVSAAQADTTEYLRVLRIPVDFTEKVLANEQVELSFDKVSGSNVEYDAAADVLLHRAQVAFLGTLIRWHQALPDSTVSLVQLGEVEKGKLLAMVAEPALITVEDRFAGKGRPVPSGAGQSIPGMMAMFVVMTVLIGGSQSLTAEKYGGTLARLATTPYSKGQILAGKILHLTTVGFVQVVVLMAAGGVIGAVHLFGIEFSWGPNAVWVAFLMIPYAFCVACMTLFISGLFRTTQQAESLGWLVGMIVSALGGCWWPLEVMPQAARLLAHAFPTYWAMEGMHSLITFGLGPASIVGPVMVLAAVGLGFWWLGTRTMRVSSSG